MPLTVNEIFSSIQGESAWAGMPCSFVRLTGCNLRCAYCDTQYAFEEGRSWRLDAILAHLASLKRKRVCLTGGEPLLQTGTIALIEQLMDNGYQVSLETNGSLDISRVDARCMKIMDVKCPSSGMQRHNRLENMKHLGDRDQVKFVISDAVDFNYACNASAEFTRHVDADRILFSPAYGKLDADKLAKWMLAKPIDARLQIQLHKVLWPEVDRGV